MVRFTCKCLNINIYSKSKRSEIDSSELGLDALDKFFEDGVFEIELDLGGITKEQDFLVKQYTVSDWVISRCRNCGLAAFARRSPHNANKALISSKLLSDPEEIEKLTKSDNYSPLFHLVLSHKEESKSSQILGLPVSSSNESVRITVVQLQQQLAKYLQREKEEMEERIRQYSEQQRDLYAKLQKQAYSDKSGMVGLVLEMEEQDLMDSISDAMSEGPLISTSSRERQTCQENNEVTMHPIKSSAIQLRREATKPSKPAATASASESVQTPATQATKKPSNNHYTSVATDSKKADDNYIFPLDEFQDNDDDCGPFSDSEGDEAEGISDNSTNEGSLYPTSTGFAIASSLPISTTHWSTHNREPLDDFDEKVQMPDPEQMVASMKALARSVHDDGTAMFGDLPRPRVNTASDLKKKVKK